MSFIISMNALSVKVLRKIEELGLEKKIELKNIRTDVQNLHTHLRKTNRSMVPCLYIGGEPLFESDDINEWLEANQDKLKD